MSDCEFSRRSVVASAVALAAGVARPFSMLGNTGTPQVVAKEYWVDNGEVKLYLYRKYKQQAGQSDASPVLFLGHGSSISSVPTFDLKVPQRTGFSMMDYFAARGFDVWTMDFEGYGRSSRTGGNSDIRRSVFDLELAVPFISRTTGQSQFHFYGESSGALRIGLYSQLHPDKVLRVGLGSFSYTGSGSPTLAKRKESLPNLSSGDRRPRDRAAISNIFTRDKDGTYDPAVPKALADMELAIPNNDSVPNGSYVDMVTKLPLLDPRKATRPFIIIRGEYDGIATEADVIDYFRQALTFDRALRIVPGASHAIGWGDQRLVAWAALHSFISA